MTNKFSPLQDRVLIKRTEKATQTASGILIPEAAQDKPQEGVILAVGPGRYNDVGVLIPVDVKIGDKVLFGKHSGTELKVGGDNVVVMYETDLLGVIE